MTTPDADYVYESLLRFNYFPMVKERRDEVPPVFTSEAFTPAISDHLLTAGRPRKSSGFDQVEYRVTRFNNVPRLHQIPHPLPYATLCSTIRDSWDNLAFVCLNDRSRIRPARHGTRIVVMEDYDRPREIDGPGRIVVMEGTRLADDLLRLDLATNAKYWVEADISTCFPSIYTHSIPWALVGHETAKKSRDGKLWYNRLDADQRYLNRGETHGLPIGPATSNLLCEIILARVDEALELRGYRFIRYIDDYHCFADTHVIAELFIRDLECEINKYLLKLNGKKVSIRKLPDTRTAPWVSQLNVALPAGDDLRPQQVLAFLDYALYLQNTNPGGSVLKYASRMLVQRSTKGNSQALVRYLLHLAAHYPVVIPVICDVLHRFRVSCNVGHVRQIVGEHIVYRRSDGVCWAIYMAYLARVPLGKSLIRKIVQSGDCMAMACLLALNKGWAGIETFLTTFVESRPIEYDLDKYWLLIYECALRDESTRSAYKEYLTDTGLAMLLEHEITFLDKPSLADMSRRTADSTDA